MSTSVAMVRKEGCLEKLLLSSVTDLASERLESAMRIPSAPESAKAKTVSFPMLDAPCY